MKILRQVIKFGRSYAIWLKEGKPIRSDDLILHIFQTHCAPCEHYDPDLKECSICECSVSENSDERNKITWASEYCPTNRWSADVDATSVDAIGTVDRVGGDVGTGDRDEEQS